MIQLIRYIEENRTIALSNDTYFEVRSTAGANYYIQADIYIDDILYKSQIWSKSDDFTAVKNMVDLYRNDFINDFTAHTSSALVIKNNLKKKVNIKLTETNISDSTSTGFVDLPTFYIIASDRPCDFIDTTPLQLLDNEINTIIASTSDVVVFSLWSTTTSVITIDVLNPSGSVIYNDDYATAQANQIHELVLNLQDVNAIAGLDYLTVRITDTDNNKMERSIRLVKNEVFDGNVVYTRNNHRQYIPYRILGELKVDHALTHEIYRDSSNKETNYSYTDTVTLSTQTGNRTVFEKETIAYLAKSIGAYIFLDGEWLSVANKTSRYNRYQDKKFNFSESLTYRFNNIKNRDNDHTLAALAATQNIVFTGDQNSVLTMSNAVLAAAILPASPIGDTIIFDSLPLLGQIYAVTPANFITVVSGVEYQFSNYTGFIYVTPVSQYGNNLANCSFRLIVSNSITTPGTISFNINEVIAPNLPPSAAFPNSLYLIPVDSVGTSIAPVLQFINASDPESGPLTYLWEVTSGASVTTLTNETTDTVSINVTTGTIGDYITIKCTVTDNAGNSTERSKSFRLVNVALQMTVSSTSVNGSQTTHNIDIIGGSANSTVEIQHQLIGGTQNQSVVIISGTNNISVNRFYNTEQISLQLDGDGVGSYQIITDDPLSEGLASLNATLAANNKQIVSPLNAITVW